MTGIGNGLCMSARVEGEVRRACKGVSGGIISLPGWGDNRTLSPVFLRAQVLRQHRKGLPEEMAARYLLGALRAVAYLHQHHVIHRDIKVGASGVCAEAIDGNASMRLSMSCSAMRLAGSTGLLFCRRERRALHSVVPEEAACRRLEMKRGSWKGGPLRLAILRGVFVKWFRLQDQGLCRMGQPN